MARSFNQIQVLLIQARGTENIEKQEQVCFQERCKLPDEQFVYHNVAHAPIPESALDGVDAVMIGGAGEFSACSDYHFTDSLLHLIHIMHDRDIPLMGACWGHQMLARAMGGTVIHDQERAEFGCRQVKLTDAGKTD